MRRALISAGFSLLLVQAAWAAPPTSDHATTHHHRAAKPRPHHPAAASRPHAPAPPVTPVAPAAPPSAPVPAPQDQSKGSVTGEPLPRFVALKTDEVNMRSGPGTRYPIEWVYHRKNLPVEVLREFEVWRLIQDQEGTKGWVHQATLVGRARGLVVTGADRTLRRSADEQSAAVAILKPGVIGRLRGCASDKDWCEVQVGDYRGYLRRGDFWGAYPHEAVGG